jgi:hypothetical protein
MRLSPSPRIKAYRAAAGLGPTSEMGQKATSAGDRTTPALPNNGHQRWRMRCPLRAKTGSAVARPTVRRSPNWVGLADTQYLSPHAVTNFRA